MADLQQKGSDFFTGTSRFSCVCQYAKGRGASFRTLTNRHTTVTTIEVTKLSATRIEGRTIIPSKDSKLDCETGTFTTHGPTIAPMPPSDGWRLEAEMDSPASNKEPVRRTHCDVDC
jgi:hypothetical protein